MFGYAIILLFPYGSQKVFKYFDFSISCSKMGDVQGFSQKNINL